MVNIYYDNDQVVEEDQELQDFVKDVYVYGMRGRKASGRVPQFSASAAEPVCLKGMRKRRQETLPPRAPNPRSRGPSPPNASLRAAAPSLSECLGWADLGKCGWGSQNRGRARCPSQGWAHGLWFHLRLPQVHQEQGEVV